MNLTHLSQSDLQSLRDNFTSHASQDGHFKRCWVRKDCQGCLNTHHCSWCPYTWACVPNSHKIPLLAPAYDKHICPAREERWELRTRPFGCQASTTTSLSVAVAAVSTLLFIVLLCLLILGVQRLRHYSRQHPGWWKFWTRPWQEWFVKKDGERQPLLSEAQPAQVAPDDP